MRTVVHAILAVSFCLCMVWAELLYNIINFELNLFSIVAVLIFDALVSYTAADMVIKTLEAWTR